MNYLTPEIVTSVFTVCVIPLLGIITKCIVSYIKAKSEQLKTYTKNEQMRQVINHAEEAITTAVQSTSQTYVDSLKKSGTFDSAAQTKAFNDAKDAAIQLIGKSSMSILAESIDDVELWITHRIESYLDYKNQK